MKNKTEYFDDDEICKDGEVIRVRMNVMDQRRLEFDARDHQPHFATDAASAQKRKEARDEYVAKLWRRLAHAAQGRGRAGPLFPGGDDAPASARRARRRCPSTPRCCLDGLPRSVEPCLANQSRCRQRRPEAERAVDARTMRAA